MTSKTASHRKNGTFGFKALVKYSDGRTYQPISKNFPTADAARDYAQKYIDANSAPKPSREEAQAKRNEKLDRFIDAWNKAAS